jgi:hypothetical protein
MMRRVFLVWLALFFSVPALAQTNTAQTNTAPANTTAFRERAEALIPVLQSTGDPNAVFAGSFLANVPVAEVRRLSAQLVGQYGPVQRVKAVNTVSGETGVVFIDYEKAILRFDMTIAADPPHQVIGLIVSGVDPRDATPSLLVKDFKALDGESAVLILPLGSGSTIPVLAYNADKPMALGSSFKLWILAELARATAARERTWRDVIPIGAASLPSGITQKWPKGTAMTLQSLATLMISISDNTATDTLLSTLGRERVDAMVGVTGHTTPSLTLPILATREAFALKMNGSADLRDAWIRGDVAARRTLLKAQANRLTLANINLPELGAGPRHIDTIEWFASPADMARTLNWLRLRGGSTALDIIAVNPGTSEGDAARFAYLGFKGGSEPGVIALNYLVQNKAGKWFAVTGSWNNQNTGVNHDRFYALMLRALALVR